MNEIALRRPAHPGLFPRSRLLAGIGGPVKSGRARVFRVRLPKRARAACARQPLSLLKAGTREQRERVAPTSGGNQPQGPSFSRNVPRRPAAAPGAAPLRRADFAALVQVLEAYSHFTPLPLDPPWADPRPDLAGDHARWLALLELAHRRDAADPYGVFGALIGIRCCGAAITSSGGANPAWRLVRGEMSAAEWQAVRAQWLMPHLKVLQELLGPAAATMAGADTL